MNIPYKQVPSRAGEEMTIPASKVPAFKPGKELKEAVK
ncbi:HU family DNA-binding protein [Priestia megaterium]